MAADDKRSGLHRRAGEIGAAEWIRDLPTSSDCRGKGGATAIGDRVLTGA